MLGNETGGCLRGLRLLHNLLLDVYTLQYISLFKRKEGPSCNVIPATAQGTGKVWEGRIRVRLYVMSPVYERDSFTVTIDAPRGNRPRQRVST